MITVVHIPTCSHHFRSEIVQNRPESSNPIVQLTKNRRLFRLGLLAAVILGIVASNQISSNGIISHSGKVEREVSTILFLALTLLQAFQTVVLARMEHSSMYISFY